MKPWLVENKKQLIRQIAQQSLPHAMVISGVKGAGKHELAQWLANVLLCQISTSNALSQVGTDDNIPCGKCKSCNLFQQQTHPDVINIELIKNSIGVDLIRNASRFFEKTAQLAENQVVVIEDADAMTESAANALLKTLEEPTNNSFILLLVKDEQRLLPTIISRCHQLKLKPPIGKDLLTYINNEQSKGEIQDPFANLSHLSELSNEFAQQQYLKLRNAFITYLITKRQRMALLNIMLTSEESIKWLERVMANLLREQSDWRTELVINDIDVEIDKITHLNRDNLWQVYLLIKRYNKQIYTVGQLNKEYALEKLLVDIFFIMNSTKE
ncbi:DNA polymerase III subunit delta' [Colwelliaceae bacterium 6441]